MNKTIKSLQLILIAFMFCSNLYSQPKPWSFGESVMISPSLYTGTMQLAIPFYTYKDADFEIPITFGYASNGCVANVRGGIMGPGWGMNVGGMITIEVKGVQDRIYWGKQQGNNFHKNHGFYFLHKQNIQQSISDFFSKLYNVFGFAIYRYADEPNKNLSSALVYCPNGYDDDVHRYDAEPDIYHFNFMGYSGSFHLGFNDSIHIYDTNIDSKSFKIKIRDSISSSNNDTVFFSGIDIYTPDGYGYIFNYYTDNAVSSLVLGVDEEPISSHIASVARIKLNLTKIIAPNGRSVTLGYERRKILNYFPAGAYAVGAYYSYIFGFGPYSTFVYTGMISPPIGDKEHFFGKNRLWDSFLKKITINGDNGTPVTEIKFEYRTYAMLGLAKEQYRASRSSLTDIDDESVKLSNITVNSKLNNTTTKITECRLTYMNNTNGARTTYLKDITIQGIGKYTMSYHHWNNSTYPYPTNGTFSVDARGYYNGYNNNNSENYPFLNITNLDANLNETLRDTQVRGRHIEYVKCGVLNQITCPTGGRYIFEYENNECTKVVRRLSTNNFIPELTTPGNYSHSYYSGLRIYSIKNYSDYPDNSLISTRRYLYRNADNTGSGILLNEPRHSLTYSANLLDGFFVNIKDNNMTFRSDNLNKFNNLHIEYATAVEILNEESSIRYSFTNSAMPGYMDVLDYSYVPETTDIGGYKTWNVLNQTTLCNIVAPVSSKQFIRGRLLKTETFSDSKCENLIYTQTNDYNNEYKNSFTVLPHYFVRALGYTRVYMGEFNPSSTTEAQKFNGVNVSTTTNCTYNAHGQVASQTTIDSKGVKQIVEYKYVTDTLTYPSGTRTIDLMAKYNIISLPLREEVYVERNGARTKIGGKRYTYFNPVQSKPALVRPQRIDIYDIESQSWITNAKFNIYDNNGNLLETENANGVRTSYIYGYNGLYKIAEISNCSLSQITSISGLSNIKNAPLSTNLAPTSETSLRSISGAEVTTFDYLPLTGLTRIRDSTGKQLTYKYNKHGKMEKVINTADEIEVKYNYSTDNN